MKLGIVCGLVSEKAALGRTTHMVAVSGANAGRAYDGARWLAAEGAECLVSFGLAGALMPHLQPGDLLLPEAVLNEGGESYPAHPLGQDLPRPADGAPLLGVDRIIASSAEKASLARSFDAASVDMESHAVARAARELHLPFYVIRAVADTADQGLPPAAQGAVRPDGSINMLATLRGILRSPGDLRELLALGRQSARGHETLRSQGRNLIEALARA